MLFLKKPALLSVRLQIQRKEGPVDLRDPYDSFQVTKYCKLLDFQNNFAFGSIMICMLPKDSQKNENMLFFSR